MVRKQVVMVGCVMFGTLSSACGEPEKAAALFRQEAWPHEEDPDNAPDTLPTGQAPPPVVSELRMTAACAENPTDMAVANRHASEPLCERISLTAVRNDTGDVYELMLPVTWLVDDPSIVALAYPMGPKAAMAVPVGKFDLFNDNGEDEPRTTVRACVTNVCPTLRSPECHDVVCASVNVESIVNVEDLWLLSGDTFEGDQPAVFEQVGRNFRDPSSGVKNGVIDRDTVSFEIDDYIYQGAISPDRKRASGKVLESLTLGVVGEWRADRVLP